MKQLITQLRSQLRECTDFEPRRGIWDHKDDSRIHLAEMNFSSNLRNNAEALLDRLENLEAGYKDVSERLDSAQDYTVNYVDKLRAVAEAAQEVMDAEIPCEPYMNHMNKYVGSEIDALGEALAALDEVKW